MTIHKRPHPDEVQRSRNKLMRFGIDWLAPKTMNVMDFVAAGTLFAAMLFVKNKQDINPATQEPVKPETAVVVDSVALKSNSSETAIYKPPSP